MAGAGKATAAGSTLSVKGESTNLAAPGDLPNWRKNYIYVQIATDDHSLYLGWDGTPEGVDVTGWYRVGDLAGGLMNPGKGCIHGMNIAFHQASFSVVYCESPAIKKISVRTTNGNDSVKLEATTPEISVPATVSSNINTGKGHDGVWGGLGADTINTGNDNDGGIEQSSTLGPESIKGFGGNDKIILGSSDTIKTDTSPWFPFEEASGGDGNDSISGKGIYNVLNGDAGDDVLRGGTGWDFLTGGLGADTMKGGLGADEIDASETPAQADLLIDCGKDGGTAILDVGVDPPGKNCDP